MVLGLQQARFVSGCWVLSGISWHALVNACHILLNSCLRFRSLRLGALAAAQVPCRLAVWVPFAWLSPLQLPLMNNGRQDEAELRALEGMNVFLAPSVVVLTCFPLPRDAVFVRAHC